MSDDRLNRIARRIHDQQRRAPRDTSSWTFGTSQPESIVDFAFDFLGVSLYPAQATILKLIFLETETLTEVDAERILHWWQGFELGIGEDGEPGFVGTFGTPP